MQSGRGEQASDSTYRPLPIPREQQTPAVPEAREGVVLPAQGEQWDGQTQIVQPSAGQPWGNPEQTHTAPPRPAPHPQVAADGEATQLMAPHYGHTAEGEKTQLLSPYQPDHAVQPQPSPYQPQPPVQPGHVATGEQSAEHTQRLRRPVSMPLPPEQQFHAPVPPLPEQPPAPAPPMPQAAPYTIRPGAPGDHPPVVSPSAAHEQAPGVTAAATQQLPRFDEAWQSPRQGLQQTQAPTQPGQPRPAQQPQDDYDFLYRKNDTAAPPTRPMAPVPPSHGGQSGFSQQPEYGYNGGGPDMGRKKLSMRAVIGIAVAACAIVGLAVGAMFSGGGNSSDQQKTAATASTTAGGAEPGGVNSAVAQQAQSLNSLLGQSGSSRSTVINAVQSIKTCGNLAAAAAELRSAAGQRDSLVTQLSELSVDQLPHHAQLVSELTTAWKASAAADEHYAQWADQMAKDKNGCRKGHASPTPQVQQGNALSGEATYAKQQAAAVWNPIAQQYGLTQRQYSQL